MWTLSTFPENSSPRAIFKRVSFCATKVRPFLATIGREDGAPCDDAYAEGDAAPRSPHGRVRRRASHTHRACGDHAMRRPGARPRPPGAQRAVAANTRRRAAERSLRCERSRQLSSGAGAARASTAGPKAKAGERQPDEKVQGGASAVDFQASDPTRLSHAHAAVLAVPAAPRTPAGARSFAFTSSMARVCTPGWAYFETLAEESSSDSRRPPRDPDPPEDAATPRSRRAPARRPGSLRRRLGGRRARAGKRPVSKTRVPGSERRISTRRLGSPGTDRRPVVVPETKDLLPRDEGTPRVFCLVVDSPLRTRHREMLGRSSSTSWTKSTSPAFAGDDASGTRAARGGVSAETRRLIVHTHGRRTRARHLGRRAARRRASRTNVS